MHTNLWFWIAFNAGVLCVLAIDLFGFQRKAHAPSTKEAAIWTAVWVVLSLGFNALIWYWEGYAKALEFLTGYLVEYSLSVDNIFVFVLVFSYFAVPAAYQHRVLFWGILSALILRGVMIGVGVALVETFHWVLYLFGAFLIFRASVRSCSASSLTRVSSASSELGAGVPMNSVTATRATSETLRAPWVTRNSRNRS